MTRILHLSDLHFGLERAALVQPLLDLVNAARADLVVVTGDLTHRAHPAQFAAAAAFLRRIEAPLIAVPGNHDIPFYNLTQRILHPYRRVSTAIAETLEPVGHVGNIRVQGVNSVAPLAWQRGTLCESQLARITATLDPACINIVALHHPLQQAPGIDKALALGASQALARLESAGVHVILSGHLHIWSIGAFQDAAGRTILQVQAGTALCARPHDRQNEFAILEFLGDDLIVERRVAPMSQPGFGPPQYLRFTRRSGRWQSL